MKRIIIFGTGHDGEEAFEFFSSEYIYCYVDNDPAKIGTKMHGKDVISPDILDTYKDDYDIIIAISKNRWMMFSVVCQLRRMGIQNFSVYTDIRKHYLNGLEFIKRDRHIYPYEQESVSEIYKQQLDYMVRHTDNIRTDYYCKLLDAFIENTDISTLKPATDEMRRLQLWIVELLHELLARLKKEIGIVPALADGTLLGAVRHRGFIPWDDDIDVSVLYEDFCRLLEYFEDADDVDVFYLSLENESEVWRSKKKISFRDSTKRYLVAYSYGYMSVFLNMKALYMRQNPSICDIFPLRCLPDKMSPEEYEAELKRWIGLLKDNIHGPDKIYKDMDVPLGLYPKKSTKIGYSFDFVSYISYWNTIQGRGENSHKIWNLQDYLPLKEIEFEGYTFAAPNNYERWLALEYGEDYRSIPQRVGIYVHDKERIFRERY